MRIVAKSRRPCHGDSAGDEEATPASPTAAAVAAAEEANAEVMAALRATRRRAAQLKAARDKLLVEARLRRPVLPCQQAAAEATVLMMATAA